MFGEVGYGQGEEMVYPALNSTGIFENSNSKNIPRQPLELVKSQKNQLIASILLFYKFIGKAVNNPERYTVKIKSIF